MNTTDNYLKEQLTSSFLALLAFAATIILALTVFCNN